MWSVCGAAAWRRNGAAPSRSSRPQPASRPAASLRRSRPPAAVLSALGRSLQFELAVGQNGRVWIAAPRCAASRRRALLPMLPVLTLRRVPACHGLVHLPSRFLSAKHGLVIDQGWH